MVISHKHKYLFVELPRTGSTAISKELRRYYDGATFLRKHTTFLEFLKVASPEEKKYFVFSTIRNPLDDIVSLYFKYKTDHDKKYTDPVELNRRGPLVRYVDLLRFNSIQKNSLDFAVYFKRFHKIPYGNWSILSHKNFDFILHFENLQNDFARVLELLDIEAQRPLPVVNKTGEKADFVSYYTPDIYGHARRVCGPFMKMWGYSFPAEWGDNSVPLLSQVAFHFINPFRIAYWKHLRRRI